MIGYDVKLNTQSFDCWLTAIFCFALASLIPSSFTSCSSFNRAASCSDTSSADMLDWADEWVSEWVNVSRQQQTNKKRDQTTTNPPYIALSLIMRHLYHTSDDTLSPITTLSQRASELLLLWNAHVSGLDLFLKFATHTTPCCPPHPVHKSPNPRSSQHTSCVFLH